METIDFGRNVAVIEEILSNTEVKIWDINSQKYLIMTVTPVESKILQDASSSSEFAEVYYTKQNNEIRWANEEV